jgi:hypothetical protein
MIVGFFVYSAGDTIATLLAGNFSIARMIGMAFLGAAIYAIEIPNWFLFIDKVEPNKGTMKSKFKRIGLAVAFFNPIWIARHMLFISLFSGKWASISWNILGAASMSFITNIPFSIFVNYCIQNKLRPEWRYYASSIFSASMAILYAMGAVWFK